MCREDWAICTESFGNTDVGGLSHGLPCLVFSSPGSQAMDPAVSADAAAVLLAENGA
jgi:hypothetical protein